MPPVAVAASVAAEAPATGSASADCCTATFIAICASAYSRMPNFRERAELRRARVTLTKKRLGEPDANDGVRGADAISLVQQLTIAAWAWSGQQLPRLRRRELPYRFIRGHTL